MRYFIKADRFLLETEEKKHSYLLIENGKFGGFVDQVPDGEQVFDYSKFTVAPGLFDTHIHGISGHDVMDGQPEAIEGISRSLLKSGVTRFLPTTLTAPDREIERAISSIVTAVAAGLSGAQSEGIYIEGPFFTEKYRGAQNPLYLKDPSIELFQKWQQQAQGSIIKIALAPERSGSLAFIEAVRNEGIFVSLGHTNARFDQVNAAIRSGANNFTHLFNGMAGLHHRDPGVVGAAFFQESAYAELICDGHHVHPAIVRLALQIMGDRLVLISDCMRAGLMPDGEYMLGEFKVQMSNGVARTETGALAGSTLTLIQAVKNLYEWSEYPLYKIWHLASLSPAASIRKDEELGSIAKGKIADYVVIDQNFNIYATAIAGEVKYQAANL